MLCRTAKVHEGKWGRSEEVVVQARDDEGMDHRSKAGDRNKNPKVESTSLDARALSGFLLPLMPSR